MCYETNSRDKLDIPENRNLRKKATNLATIAFIPFSSPIILNKSGNGTPGKYKACEVLEFAKLAAYIGAAAALYNLF